MIASSLQGLLICYGESLSGTLRTIYRVSEDVRSTERKRKYIQVSLFQTYPSHDRISPCPRNHQLQEFHGILWGSCTALGRGPLSRVNPEFWTGSSQKGNCLFADSQNGLILLELTPHRDGVLSFLIPPCFDETLMVDPPCLARAAMARKALSAICFFGSGFCVVYLCLKHHHHDVWLLGVAGCHYSIFWWPVGVCNPNFKFIKVLAILVYETKMDLDVAKT